MTQVLRIYGGTLTDLHGDVQERDYASTQRREFRVWLRGIRFGEASGYVTGSWRGAPIPQPRPKARRRALVWDGKPQIRLTLKQQLWIDRVRVIRARSL